MKTCGNCKYFELRLSSNSWGDCTFTLPMCYVDIVSDTSVYKDYNADNCACFEPVEKESTLATD